MISVIKTVKGVLLEVSDEERVPLLEMLLATSQLPGRSPVISNEPWEGTAEKQKLLEECMRERGKENHHKVCNWMKDRSRWTFQQNNKTWRWKLSFEEVEELLMFLNTIRVSLWVQLGCPESTEVKAISVEQLPLLGGLHLIGAMQEEILKAVS